MTAPWRGPAPGWSVLKPAPTVIKSANPLPVGPGAQHIQALFDTAAAGSPHGVRLGSPLPLYVRYATCTAETGRLCFLADVYHRDEALRQVLFGLSL